MRPSPCTTANGNPQPEADDMTELRVLRLPGVECTGCGLAIQIVKEWRTSGTMRKSRNHGRSADMPAWGSEGGNESGRGSDAIVVLDNPVPELQ